MTANRSTTVPTASGPWDPPRPKSPAKPQGEVIRQEDYLVLVIDDDFLFREFVHAVLRNHGFAVLTASSGAMGLAFLNAAPRQIQIVLLDYSMPELNGAETLQQLRNRNPSIKIVAITAFAPHEVAPSFREGVDGYIVKPIHAQELIEIIDSLIGSKPSGS
jgi:CheY-like chemotaxis protein